MSSRISRRGPSRRGGFEAFDARPTTKARHVPRPTRPATAKFPAGNVAVRHIVAFCLRRAFEIARPALDLSAEIVLPGFNEFDLHGERGLMASYIRPTHSAE